MRDRKKQRLLRKSGIKGLSREKGLSPKDETALPDPTPFEAVRRIIEKEKKELSAHPMAGRTEETAHSSSCSQKEAD